MGEPAKGAEVNSDRKKSAHLVATERGRKIWRRLLPVNEGELNYEALVLGGRWHIPRHVHPFSVPHQPRYSPGYSGFPPRYAGTEVGEKIFLNAEQIEIPAHSSPLFLFFFFWDLKSPEFPATPCLPRGVNVWSWKASKLTLFIKEKIKLKESLGARSQTVCRTAFSAPRFLRDFSN